MTVAGAGEGNKEEERAARKEKRGGAKQRLQDP
jgi:hypothetical protein